MENETEPRFKVRKGNWTGDFKTIESAKTRAFNEAKLGNTAYVYQDGEQILTYRWNNEFQIVECKAS